VGSVNDFSSASNTYSGIISGPSSVLTLDAGAGTLTLANTASWAYGGIVIQAGMLKFATTAALSNNPLTIDGGTLDMGGWSKFTLTTLAGSGGFIESSSGATALTFNLSTSSDYSGSIVNGKGSVSLTKSGGGTLILAGSDTYTGGTTVAGGVLELVSPAALPDGAALTVGADAALIFDASLLSGEGQPSISPRPRPWVHGARGEGQASVSPLPYSGEGQGVRAVPEPGTLVLLLVAALCSAAACRRFSKRASTCPALNPLHGRYATCKIAALQNNTPGKD
jgi:autotransporter-associated beta strand protein